MAGDDPLKIDAFKKMPILEFMQVWQSMRIDAERRQKEFEKTKREQQKRKR